MYFSESNQSRLHTERSASVVIRPRNKYEKKYIMWILKFEKKDGCDLLKHIEISPLSWATVLRDHDGLQLIRNCVLNSEKKDNASI